MLRQISKLAAANSWRRDQCHNVLTAKFPLIQYGLPNFLNFSSAVRDTSKDFVATHDCFDILGIDRSFAISSKELKTKYKNLMKELHPDRHSSLSEPSSSSMSLEDEKSLKTSMATDVTRAYSVVENPLLRALHLLDLWGSPIGEEDHSIINNKLLLEIMEVREEIEDASCDKELRPLLQSCQVKQNELCEQLAAAFREERIDEAKYLTAQLQYWYRVEETIMDKISSVH